ncbi:hypothetical protein RAD15_36930 [Bradyrhizobium sp. 14AA]
MTRGVVLDLDQAGLTRLSHSRLAQFNIDPGNIFGKVFRMMAHT